MPLQTGPDLPAGTAATPPTTWSSAPASEVLTGSPCATPNGACNRGACTRQGFRAGYWRAQRAACCAGLCCAALLARYGYSVTVCEAHYHAGGAAHSFEVQGYKFDSGPSFFAGLSGTMPAITLMVLTTRTPINCQTC